MPGDKSLRLITLITLSVWVSSCTGSAPTTAAATNTPSALPAPTGTATPAPTSTRLASPTTTLTGTPAASQTVVPGQELSITQIVGLSFIDAQHGWLLAVSCHNNTCPATMRVSQDGGQTWTRLPAPAAEVNFFPNYPLTTTEPASVSAVRFANPQDGWVWGPNLFSTHDGGQTWTDEKQVIGDLVVTNKAVWAVEQQGTKPVIERSMDAGKSWMPVSMPPVLIGWPSLTSADQKTAWLYAQDSLLNAQLISTQDGGASWLELQPPASRCLTHVLRAVSTQFLWFVCGNEPATAMQEKSVYTSSDGGSSWTLQADSMSKDPATQGITNQGHILSPGGFAALSPFIAFMALNRDTLITTTDGGRKWRDAVPYERTNGGADPAMGPVEFTKTHAGWLAVGPNRLFRTTDGGQSWNETAVP